MLNLIQERINLIGYLFDSGPFILEGHKDCGLEIVLLVPNDFISVELPLAEDTSPDLVAMVVNMVDLVFQRVAIAVFHVVSPEGKAGIELFLVFPLQNRD